MIDPVLAGPKSPAILVGPIDQDLAYLKLPLASNPGSSLESATPHIAPCAGLFYACHDGDPRCVNMVKERQLYQRN